MIMFPAHRQNLNKKNSFGGYGGGCGYYDCFISLGGGSDLMAEDESGTEISINGEEATGSSSKDIIHQEINKDEDGGWLRLSLGSGHVQSNRPSPDHQISLGPRLVELDLLPGGSGSTSSGGGETWSLTLTAPPQQQHQLSFQVPDFGDPIPITAAAPTFLLQPRRGAAGVIESVPPMTFTHHQQYGNSYMPFRPYPLNMTTTLSSPSSFPASLDQLPASSSRPLHFHTEPPLRIDFRVVDPPPRPHSGVWFVLQASRNQRKEPYLPQIPKSYLRIKDGRTTVRLLIKYLVNKLKLDSEFEVEITCKGQQLLPFLTLQHVRDNIWNRPRNDILFPHSSATIDHLMVLNYGRIA